jgi:hypothetical protein
VTARPAFELADVGNWQQLGLTSGEPLRSRRRLTLRAMAVSAFFAATAKPTFKRTPDI